MPLSRSLPRRPHFRDRLSRESVARKKREPRDGEAKRSLSSSQNLFRRRAMRTKPTIQSQETRCSRSISEATNQHSWHACHSCQLIGPSFINCIRAIIVRRTNTSLYVSGEVPRVVIVRCHTCLQKVHRIPTCWHKPRSRQLRIRN